MTPWLDLVPVSHLTEHGGFNLTNKQRDQDTMTILVSHQPILLKSSNFTKRVMEQLKPDMIFSAHHHRGFLYTMDKEGHVTKEAGNKKESTTYILDTRNKVKVFGKTYHCAGG